MERSARMMYRAVHRSARARLPLLGRAGRRDGRAGFHLRNGGDGRSTRSGGRRRRRGRTRCRASPSRYPTTVLLKPPCAAARGQTGRTDRTDRKHNWACARARARQNRPIRAPPATNCFGLVLTKTARKHPVMRDIRKMKKQEHYHNFKLVYVTIALQLNEFSACVSLI